MTINLYKLIEEALVGEVYNHVPAHMLSKYVITAAELVDHGIGSVKLKISFPRPHGEAILTPVRICEIDKDIELVDLPPFNLKKTLDDLLIDETLKNAGKITKWTIRTCIYIDINVCSSTMLGSTTYKINDDIELAD